MNAEQRQSAAGNCTTPTDLRQSMKVETTSTIAICYYSARKLILTLPPHCRG